MDRVKCATLCSRNVHKARELEQLLPGWTIQPLEADEWPPEMGETYYENAHAKAEHGRRAERIGRRCTVVLRGNRMVQTAVHQQNGR